MARLALPAASVVVDGAGAALTLPEAGSLLSGIAVYDSIKKCISR